MSGALHIPDLPADADNLTAALAYAEAGWYLLPVKHGTKTPGSIVGKRWHDKSAHDSEQIAAWFAGADHDIALHCGRSGAVVFDVDHPDKLPPALRPHLRRAPYQSTRQDTLGRGHYLFAVPPGRNFSNSVGRLGGGWGEVRGSNGVIIVAPSSHRDGGRYRWKRTGDLPVLPDELAQLLDDASPAEDAVPDAALESFIAAHTCGTRPELIDAWTTMLGSRFAAGESRHQSAITVVVGACKEARAGYFPARDVLVELRKAFLDAVTKPPASGKQGAARTAPEAASEWRGIVAWSVGQALAADLDEVRARVNDKMPDDSAGIRRTARPPADPITLTEAHEAFTDWLGDDYDTDALDAMLAVAAVERFNDGSDPVWLLLISGPGNAKTETVQALDGINAVVTSCLSSEAALLSATPKRERAKDATGGLLKRIGDHGVLVLKDVTSILSMDRNLRGRVLAALREIYDGRWVREVGADGGRMIPWEGRIAVVGAVTTAWDTAHAVIAAMGDRFVLVRLDSTTKRQAAGRKAVGNTGAEPRMRAALADAVAGALAGAAPEPVNTTEDENAVLLAAADLVTLARTGVEYDYRGDVIDAHAPEMPTRFAKQLVQIVRGAVAVGMKRPAALRLAIRCARDSMPPLRLAIIDDLAAHPHSSTGEVRRRLDKPRKTVDRQLQALHILGVLTVDEQEYYTDGRTRWFYTLANEIDPSTLSVPDLLLTTPNPNEGSEREGVGLQPVPHISGPLSSNGQAIHTQATRTTP